MGSNDCLHVTLDECKTQCVLADHCTGISVSVDGDCCARSNVDISECDSTSEWDTYELTTASRMTTGQCLLHSAINIAHCETHDEAHDTYIRAPAVSNPWWLTTHFVERTFMPRRYKCTPGPGAGSCTLQELQALLPSVRDQGYSVVNVSAQPHHAPSPTESVHGERTPCPRTRHRLH